MELSGLKINFLGDSITYGAGVSGPDKIFHAILKRETGIAEVRNYGIGSTRYAVQKGTDYRPKDTWADTLSFCERFGEMDDDADMIVVFGGTNDYGHGDAPLGCMGDRTPETFYGACHYLYSGLITKYPGKPIVIMTPTHRINETSNIAERPVAFGTLKQYVDIIREVAEFYSLPVFDLFKISGLQPEVPVIRETYMPDGLHPNDKGHEIIADKLKKFLQAL